MNLKLIASILTTLIWNLTTAQTEKLWERSHQLSSDSFECYGMVLDSIDNQYVYGQQGEIMFLQKRDKAGNLLWTKNENLIGEYLNGQDSTSYPITKSKIQDLKIQHGHIYISGWCNASGFNLAYVAKLSTDGDTLWTRLAYEYSNFSVGHGYAWLNTEVSLAFDSSSNVYVSYTGDWFSIQVLTAKYSANGEMYWLKRMLALYDGTEPIKYVKSLSISGDRLFILAFSKTPFWVKWNTIVYSLDTSGTILWYRYEGGRYSLNYSKVLLADQGNVYLIAETKDSTQIQQSVSCIKYSKDSTRLWRTNINFSSSSADSPLEAFIDDSSNIYITCITTDSGSKGVFYTVKLDSSGAIKWLTSGKQNTERKRINIPFTGGNNPNKKTTASAKGILNGEGDLLTIWKDSLNNPNELDKTLHCGLHLWNQVSDSSYSPLSIKKGTEGYYLVFQSGRRLIVTKFKDTTENNSVSLLSVQPASAKSTRIEWTNPSGNVYGTKIERSTDGQNFSLIDSVTFGATYTDTFLTPNTSYYYRIYSYDFFGNRCPLEMDSATTLDNVGLGKESDIEIHIYPNPVCSELNIKGSLSNFEYTLYDLLGKIRLAGTGADKIEVRSLEPGFYFLTIKTDSKQSITYKILKT